MDWHGPSRFAGLALVVGAGMAASRMTESQRSRGMITRAMVSWKGEQFWLGKLLEHPEVMTPGETIEDLEGHLRDASRLLVLDDVPADPRVASLEV
jgi:hypothetical protein